jgi:hypothetical protein
METFEKVYGTYHDGKFWLITTLISGASAYILFGVLSGPKDILAAVSLVFALIGVFLLPFAVYQRLQRKRFFEWLSSQWENLETGARHPDGYLVTFDTPLVRYKLVFSALIATVSFASRPYVSDHSSAGAVQASFTIFSLLFGWWFLGPEGVVETLSAVYGNLRRSDTFTLRELILKSQGSGGAENTRNTDHSKGLQKSPVTPQRA